MKVYISLFYGSISDVSVVTLLPFLMLNVEFI